MIHDPIKSLRAMRLAGQRDGAELPRSARTLNGATFNPHQDVWQYRDTTLVVSLDFKYIQASSPFITSAKKVFLWYAENKSSHHLLNVFSRLEHFCRTLSLGASLKEISPTHLINYRSSLTERNKWFFGTLSGLLKRWHQMALPGVSRSAAELLHQLRNAGNVKGEAIMTFDPFHGPLSDIDLSSICSRLDEAYYAGEVELEHYALALLYISLGQRSVQYASLKLCDFSVCHLSIGDTEYLLRVPRAKQRNEASRTYFKERLLIAKVGAALDLHCQSVREKHSGTLDEVDQMPIFPAHESRRNEPQGFAFHRTSDSLALTLEKTVNRLGIRSTQTGTPLHVTATRFRRTVGTRAAMEGHGALIVAELLDHTDTQNVGVYVSARPEIIERIDRAIAFELAPLAQAFAGTLVRDESQARRGNEPGSRVLDPRIAPRDQAMGTCGQYGFCGFMAPIACYTCRNFQPWLDGPHQSVLEFLLAERERLSKDCDLRIASINDRTILAVTEVILKCSQIKSERQALGA